MLERIYALLVILAVLAILAYATWLLVKRLHGNEPRFRSFRDWLQHVFEAIWGI